MILETFVRTFVDLEALDATVGFYKALLAGEETLRFDYPELGLRLAFVSSPRLSVLVIARPPEKRKPFKKRPWGRKMRYRHADGLIVEYVDHAS